MRAFITTVRILASLVYCLLAFVGCLIAFLVLWSLIVGSVPYEGLIAHGNVPLPSYATLGLVLLLLSPLIGCDIYFRRKKRYHRNHDHVI
jgi:hypothetical protein